MIKLLFTSDSFKGSLSSEKTIELLTQAANEIFDECECSGMAVADGGEGTTDAVISAVSGEKIYTKVHGPLMELTESYYGKIDETKAIIEMAAASGLPKVPESLRNPENTTTFGTGEMILDALDHGFTDISIAIGGSATNDGGMGCMRALGVRFLDKEGHELMGFGRDLIHLHRIDLSQIDPRIEHTTFTAMCDVTNPLCGKNGATYTFGGQKGGTPEILDHLEEGMQNYRDVIIQTFGINPDLIPGSGAAGGLGAALTIFLHAEMKSGIETVLDLIHFENKLQDVSLVVTGEGQTDWQSCYGKVLQGVGMRCKKHNIPAVALVGSMAQGAEDIYDYGITSIMTTVNAIMDLDHAIDHAETLYLNGARRMFRFIKAGLNI